MACTVSLPWPSPALSPNARGHWGVKARAVKRYRHDAAALARAAGCRKLACDRLAVAVTFYPPDRRQRDTDNMLASIKSGLDGIADALGVDDSRWELTISRGDPVQGGRVDVVVSAGGS